MEFFSQLTNEQVSFIATQPMFFVATAAQGARINLSPKGMDSFRVISPHTVGYLDLGGSGNETQAHLTADGRITIMFCSFDQSALILRIYGRGRAVLTQDTQWDEWAKHFNPQPGVRQLFIIDVDSVQTSCGWGVPLMKLESERHTLAKYHQNANQQERIEKVKGRTRSIDGLPVIPHSEVARFSE